MNVLVDLKVAQDWMSELRILLFEVVVPDASHHRACDLFDLDLRNKIFELVKNLQVFKHCSVIGVAGDKCGDSRAFAVGEPFESFQLRFLLWMRFAWPFILARFLSPLLF